MRHKLPEALVEDKDALGRVEEAGRAALAEMRLLLGAMRRDGDGVDLTPQPGLDGLEALADDVGRAGLPGAAPLRRRSPPAPARDRPLRPTGSFRKGLTNALKHAQATQADVTVRYRPNRVELEVRDDGKSAAASDGLGHGLVGIRERVKIYGGDMSAGPAPDGGFVLSAQLPVENSVA